MNKKDLIARAAVAFTAAHISRGAKADMDLMVAWAEHLWERLSARGYGAATPQAPRAAENGYAKLQGANQQWFDDFWRAFNHKQGRSRAALAWHKLGDLTTEQARQIIAAAKKEAARPLPEGQSRKMAEGWLSERRWEDHDSPAAKPRPAVQRNGRLRDLLGEIKALENLAAHDKSGAMAKKLTELQAEKAAIEKP